MVAGNPAHRSRPAPWTEPVSVPVHRYFHGLLRPGASPGASRGWPRGDLRGGHGAPGAGAAPVEAGESPTLAAARARGFGGVPV